MALFLGRQDRQFSTLESHAACLQSLIESKCHLMNVFDMEIHVWLALLCANVEAIQIDIEMTFSRSMGWSLNFRRRDFMIIENSIFQSIAPAETLTHIPRAFVLLHRLLLFNPAERPRQGSFAAAFTRHPFSAISPGSFQYIDNHSIAYTISQVRRHAPRDTGRLAQSTNDNYGSNGSKLMHTEFSTSHKIVSDIIVISNFYLQKRNWSDRAVLYVRQLHFVIFSSRWDFGLPIQSVWSVAINCTRVARVWYTVQAIRVFVIQCLGASGEDTSQTSHVFVETTCFS
ncbi:unnamed protein product [Albugo candida]|uniref:Uncharacterized protein n=1 Tax=Albugo candida TaxID=65357 RepID=A0A024GB43_9STRA|nr:unnamed protein product [Albugo candida]|eukprot:CCI44086.1 unnamed protein product [Albugo candida]